MKLLANKATDEQTIAFTLVQDEGDVNIEANNEVIGFFREVEGKILFHTLEPVDNDGLFSLDSKGYLKTTPYNY